MSTAIRVLYVDDEPPLLELGKLNLEQSGDFTVTTALSAPEAIRLLEHEKFETIISDYQMPGMDGIQFLVEVRARFGPIPFILFTGRGREEVVIQAINSGADFYLQKGGDPGAQFAELAHKVKSAASRKKADDALRVSEEKYRHLIEHADEAIVVVQNGMPKLVNHQMVELTGYSEQELLSMSISAFIHPDDRTMVMERYQKRLKGEELPSRYAFRMSSKDGSTRWVEISVVVINWEGRPATLNFLTDITDRKRAEETLRESEEKFRSLAESSLDYIMRYDRQCRHTYMNPAALRVSGLTEDKIIGKTHRESGFDESLSRFWEEKITGVFETGKPYQTQFAWESVDGRVVLDWMLTPEFSLNGTVRSVLGVSRDITQLKKAEEELLKKNKELTASYEQISATEEELRQQYEEITITQQALRESETRYREFFTTSRDCVFITSPDGRLIDFNDATLEMFGYDNREEMSKVSIPSLYAHSEDRSVFLNLIVRDGYVKEFPVQLKQRDGTVIDSLITGVPLRNPDGTIKALIGTARDITEQKKAGQDLHKAYHEYQNLLDQIQDVYYRSDPDGNLIIASRSWATLLGYDSIDECIGKPIAEGFYANPEARKPFLDAIRRDGYVTEYEVTLRRKDGSHVLVSTSSHYYYDDNRTILGVEGTFRDITERKRAEETLRESEERLNLAIDSANLGLWDMNLLNGEMVHNQRWAEMLGFSMDELEKPSEWWGQRVHPDDYQNVLKLSALHRAGKASFFEAVYRMKHKNGEWRWVHSKGKVISKDSTGASLRMIGVNQDITGQKVAEQDILKKNEDLEASYEEITATEEELRQTLDQLTRNEGKLREIQKELELTLDATTDGIWKWDFSTNLLAFSPRYYLMLGYQPGEFPPTFESWQNLIHPDDRVNALAVTETYLATKPETYENELRLRTKSREYRWIHASARVVERDASGAALRMIGNHQDITERKRAEEALHQANRKLNLLSGITRHDIKNQLTVLMGYLDLLEMKQPDPTLIEYFKKLTIAADRISAMIQFTKTYENIGVNAPAWQDAGTVADATAKDVSLGNVQLDNDLPAGTEVYADPLIAKVFYTLIDNAVRHGGTITTIRFSSEERNGNRFIVCEDDGVGVPAEEKEKIFERGFGKNTGLGLFLAREILDITGIAIRETGEPGKGARFEIAVPKGTWRTTGNGA